MFEGLEGESTADLEVDTDPPATPSADTVYVKSRRARLAQGANSGLYAFDINQIVVATPVPTPVATPTPSGPPAFCSLTVSSRCKKPVKKKTVCELTGSMKNIKKKPLYRGTFRLQRSTSKQGPWTPIGGTQKTDKKGLKVIKTKMSGTAWYRSVGLSHVCTSKPLQIKVKK